eukprot:1680028-Rhodomonas_salina.1
MIESHHYLVGSSLWLHLRRGSSSRWHVILQWYGARWGDGVAATVRRMRPGESRLHCACHASYGLHPRARHLTLQRLSVGASEVQASADLPHASVRSSERERVAREGEDEAAETEGCAPWYTCSSCILVTVLRLEPSGLHYRSSRAVLPFVLSLSLLEAAHKPGAVAVVAKAAVHLLQLLPAPTLPQPSPPPAQLTLPQRSSLRQFGPWHAGG